MSYQLLSMFLSTQCVLILVQIFGFQTIFCASLLSPRGLFSFDVTTTLPPPTSPKPPTPPPQIASYVGVDGLARQLSDINENTKRNTKGTLFTLGTNTAAFSTNLLNELSKVTRNNINSYMAFQSRLLDSLINANQAVETASLQNLNGTHKVVKSTLDSEIHNWDLMTDMFATGAKNAVNSEGGSPSSINIKTNIVG